MIGKADDIVADFVRQMRESHPEIPVLEWQRFEVGFRAEFGGGRYYVKKAATVERLIMQPPAGIDCLLLEGTHVRSRAEPTGPQLTEKDVEEEALKIMLDSNGIVLVLYSAQNID